MSKHISEKNKTRLLMRRFDDLINACESTRGEGPYINTCRLSLSAINAYRDVLATPQFTDILLTISILTSTFELGGVFMCIQ